MPQFLTEWKAGKIQDPIARLQYLQQKIGPGTIHGVSRRTRWKAVSLLPAMPVHSRLQSLQLGR
jgi:hypothetical protein